MADKKEKLNLRPKPKQTIQLNRPAIMTISIIVVTVMLLAVISAFTSKKQVKTKETKIKVITDKPSAVTSELKNLPEGYTDINAIRKYIPEEGKNELKDLMLKFNMLEKDHEKLKRDLASSQKKPSAAPHKKTNPQDQKAKTSNLVFGNLGSGVTNLVGGKSPGGKKSTSRSSKFSSKKGGDDVIATKEQIELIQQQNENERKLAVAKGLDDPKLIYDMHNVIKPVSKFQIQAGNFISATLITGIDTTVRGTIIAQVRSNLYDSMSGKYLLVPKGSKLLGQYSSNIKDGQRRILLAFTRLVRPDGSSILLGDRKGIFGMDGAGKGGIEGNVDNHWGRIIGASTISTILNVGAGIAESSGSQGSNYPNSKQNAIKGAATGISQVGQKITDKAVNIKPTITLPPGHQFNVAVHKDMVLTPYKPRRY